MGLFFKSRRRSSGGGLLGLIIIIGALYYTGALPVIWSHVKNLGSSCYSMMNSLGVGGQSICGGINNFMEMIDRNVQGIGDGAGNWFSDAEQQFDETWASSQTRTSLTNLTAQVDEAMNAFNKSGLVSGQSTLDSLMKAGPGSLETGGSDMGQLRGAMDSFAIGKQLMGSQPGLGTQWMQKGASMGEFGLMPQMSLGNSYMQAGNTNAALSYFKQAQASLNTLQSSQSPASQELLSGLSVSPAELQAQITAAIKQMQPR